MKAKKKIFPGMVMNAISLITWSIIIFRENRDCAFGNERLIYLS